MPPGFQNLNVTLFKESSLSNSPQNKGERSGSYKWSRDFIQFSKQKVEEKEEDFSSDDDVLDSSKDSSGKSKSIFGSAHKKHVSKKQKILEIIDDDPKERADSQDFKEI